MPLAEFNIEGPVAFTVKAGGKTESWKQGEQIAIRAPETGVAENCSCVQLSVKSTEPSWA